MTATVAHADGRGTRSRYTAGCRCDLCRVANTEYQRKANAARRAREIPAGVAHGTTPTYSNWGCRCAPCLGAGSAANRAGLIRRRAAGLAGKIPDTVRHGTVSTYSAWYCRCVECRAANSIHERAKYARRRAAGQSC